MKRLFTYFAMMVAMVATLVGCTKDESTNADYKCAVPNDAAFVARFDVNQVLVKSGLKTELTQMLRMQLQAEGAPEFVLELVNDFRNTGIDVEAPMYLFAKLIDSNNIFVSCVAKTYNKNMLDKLLNLASQGAIEKRVVSGCTVVPIEDGIVMAYNDIAVVYGIVVPLEENYGYRVKTDSTPYIVEALQNATNGNGGAALPAYEGSDAAVCLNMASLVDMIKPQILKEATGRFNSDIAYALEMLDKSRNSKIDLALNFANGSINLDFKTSNFPKVEGFQMPVCSNQNLDKVSADALLVANLPLNGGEYVKAFTALLEQNPSYKQMLNQVLAESGAGAISADMVINLVSPLLSSVNGDITVAVNGVMPTNNDYAFTADVDACAMVNVTNSSIMSAVEMSGFTNDSSVVNLGNSNYRIKVDGVDVYFGQKDNLLYASTPVVVAPKYPSATAASWYPAVQCSHAYVVANLSSLLSIPQVKQEVQQEVIAECGAAGYSVMQLVNSLDYLLLTAPTQESLNLRLVLKNKNENSLKQVVDAVKYVVYTNM